MYRIYTLLIAVLITASCSKKEQKTLFESSPNFRELSGIINNENKTLKKGLIYRSGSFSNFSENEKNIFKSLKINTIVDFRSDFEIEREPDYIPKNQTIDIKNAPIGSLANKKAMQDFMKVLNAPNFNKSSADSLMIAANRNFIKNIKDFKPFFNVIKDDNNRVVLFHCSAGKDRTGMAASLFLHILDVPFDIILKDYLKSNKAAKKIDEKKLAMYGVPIENIKMLMGVKESYLKAGWNEIIKKYGSVDKMLLTEFGIDAKTKQKIKNRYLK